MKSRLLFLFLLMVPLLRIGAQITLIPDPEFEGYLVFEGIDSDGEINGQVLTADIEDETIITLQIFPSLTDLTGIQDFTSLEQLFLVSVGASEVDLSHNLNLFKLEITDLPLNGLDISTNLNLTDLEIDLDRPSHMFESNVTSLNLTSNAMLHSFHLNYSKVESIDLSANLNLEFIIINFPSFLNQVDLQNGNNENIFWLEILNTPSLTCIQVDDPLAVLEGNPPYDSWNIENTAAISDDCFILHVSEFNNSETVISPNPFKGSISVHSESTISEVILYDMIGQQIGSWHQGFDSLDLSDMASGIYFTKVVANGKTETIRLVKE